MTMLVATCDIPGEDVRAGKTRISADHALARSHASAFAPAPPLPPFGEQSEIRTTHPTTGRVVAERDPTARPVTAREARIIRTRVQQIAQEDRQSYEPPADREGRVFWEQTERLLDAQRGPEQRTPALYEIDHVLSAEEQAALERIDSDWGWDRS
jgi:hypothetical protein